MAASAAANYNHKTNPKLYSRILLESSLTLTLTLTLTLYSSIWLESSVLDSNDAGNNTGGGGRAIYLAVCSRRGSVWGSAAVRVSVRPGLRIRVMVWVKVRVRLSVSVRVSVSVSVEVRIGVRVRVTQNHPCGVLLG